MFFKTSASYILSRIAKTKTFPHGDATRKGTPPMSHNSQMSSVFTHRYCQEEILNTHTNKIMNRRLHHAQHHSTTHVAVAGRLVDLDYIDEVHAS